MSIADLFNIPGDDNQMAFWSRTHMIWHRSCNLAILRQFNIVLPEFLLDPIDPAEAGSFLQNHQTMHNNLDIILNISSFDLVDVDWEDANERIGWFQAHAQLSQEEANKLGISA